MSHFLHMGGYARFVWPSYALTLAVIVLNIWWARHALRTARQAVRRRMAALRQPAAGNAQTAIER